MASTQSTFLKIFRCSLFSEFASNNFQLFTRWRTCNFCFDTGAFVPTFISMVRFCMYLLAPQWEHAFAAFELKNDKCLWRGVRMFRIDWVIKKLILCNPFTYTALFVLRSFIMIYQPTPCTLTLKQYSSRTVVRYMENSCFCICYLT